jgi:hypothetical protein
MRTAAGARWIYAGIFVGIALGGTAAAADDGAAPERFLAADSSLYWRFDGWTPHQSACSRTAFADVLRGGTGEFLESCQQFACKQLSDATIGQPLLAGRPPRELKILRAAAKQVPLLWPAIEQHGVALGIEPAGNRRSPRLTAVLPQGKPLYLAARLLVAQFADAPVERRIRDRLVLVSEPQPSGSEAETQTADISAGSGASEVQSSAKGGATGPKGVPVITASHGDSAPESKEPAPVRTVAWAEGDDLVIVVAAQTSDEMVASVLSRRLRNLLSSPLYKEVTGFNDYETLSRGFVDVQSTLRDIAKLSGFDMLPGIAAAAGLDNARQLIWHTGIEGRHQRYTIDIDIPGERKGIVSLFTGAALRGNEHLPPLPPDLNQFHLFSLRMEGIDDVAQTVAPTVAQIFGDRDEADTVRAANASVHASAKKRGIDIRRDLVDSLGPRLLIYNSPSEGPLFTGAGIAIQTVNPEKLRKVLDQFGNLARSYFGGSLQILHRDRHGVAMVSMRLVNKDNNNSTSVLSPMPSYAIHDGWLVIALYPQTIDGFILRSSSQCPQLSSPPSNLAGGSAAYQTWQPSPLLRQIVANEVHRSPAARIVSIHESDPRPVIRFALSMAPIAGSFINVVDSEQFDNRLIPNTQSVVERLYPNVSIVTDDGRRLRIDGYKSAPFPFDSSLAIFPGYLFLENN